MNGKLKVAVVVGYHTFQVCQFQEMFEAFPGIHFYIQHLEQFTSSSEEVRRSYDVVVFYTMQYHVTAADHPENIRSVAWTNHYKDARVFCYQSGHDAFAYNHESFRKILYQGILWAAKQI